MLLEALDHGESDLRLRRLAEHRVEAHRIVEATKKALGEDADLLDAEERTKIEEACVRAATSAAGSDPSRVRADIEALDAATKAFAGRRMDRAIAQAIEGRRVDAVEKSVEHAKGIEAAHATGPR
jgi:molecular chaperone HscA